MLTKIYVARHHKTTSSQWVKLVPEVPVLCIFVKKHCPSEKYISTTYDNTIHVQYFKQTWGHQAQTHCPTNKSGAYLSTCMKNNKNNDNNLTFFYSTVYSRQRSKKTSKFRVTGLCVGNSPVTEEFPSQMASDDEKVSIWWRHHELFLTKLVCVNRECSVVSNLWQIVSF